MRIIKFIIESIYYLPERCPLVITVGLITFPWLKFHYGLCFAQGLITCPELKLVSQELLLGILLLLILYG